MPVPLQTMMKSFDCIRGAATAAPSDKTNHASTRLAMCLACRRVRMGWDCCRFVYIERLDFVFF